MADYSEQYELKVQLEDAGIIEKLSGIDQALKRVSKTTTIKVNASGLNGVTSTLNGISSGLNKLSSISGGVGEALSGIGGKLTKLSGMTLAPAVAGVTALGGAVTKVLENSASRFDTLNNATKTFQNMSIDKSSISKGLTDISSYLKGLPTGLDTAMQGIQSFVGTTGSLDRSIQIYKAVNDGILAFGGSAVDSERAIRDLNEAMASGKINAQTWNSLTTNMPAVMSKMLGKFGKPDKDNPISSDKFLDALIELDTKGGDSLASLNQMAKDNTKGVQTSFENVKNALNRMGASWLHGLNGDQLAADGVTVVKSSNNISNAFSKVGDIADHLGVKLKPVFSELAKDFMPKIEGSLGNLDKYIQNLDVNKLITGFKSGFQTLKETISSISSEVKGMFETSFNIAQKLPFIGNIISSLKSGLTGGEGDIGQFIGNWLSTGLQIGFTGIKFKLAGKGFNIFSKITSLISSGFGGAGSIAKFISSKLSKEVSEGVNAGASKINLPSLKMPKLSAKAFGKDGKIADAGVSSLLTSVEENFDAQAALVKSKIPGIFEKGISKINAALGTASKAIGVVGKAGFTFEGLGILDQIRQTIKNYNLKQIQELYNDLPPSYPDLTQRLQALTTFSSSLSKVDLRSGLEQFGDSVVNGIGGAGAIVSAIPGGQAVGTGMTASAFIIKGLQFIDDIRQSLKISQIKSIFSLAKDLQDIDVSKLSSINIGEKIAAITNALKEVYNSIKPSGGEATDFNFDVANPNLSIGAVVTKLDEYLPNEKEMSKVTKVLGDMKTISSSLTSIGGIGQFKNIGTGISNLRTGLFDLLTALGKNTKNETTTSLGIKFQPTDNLAVTLDNLESTLDPMQKSINKVQPILAKFNEIQSSLQGIGGITNLPKIGDGIAHLKSSLVELVHSLTSKSGKDDTGTFINSQDLSSDNSFAEIIDQAYGQVSSVQAVLPRLKELIAQIPQINEALAPLQNMSDISDVQSKITVLKTALAGIDSIYGTLNSLGKNAGMSGIMGGHAYGPVLGGANAQGLGDTGIQDNIEQLLTLTSQLPALVNAITTLKDSLAPLDQVGDLTPSLTLLQTTLTQINQIQGILSSFGGGGSIGSGLGTTVGTTIGSMQSSGSSGGALAALDQVQQIADKLPPIAASLSGLGQYDLSGVGATIGQIISAVNQLSAISGGGGALGTSVGDTIGQISSGGGLSSLVNDLKNVATAILGINPAPLNTAAASMTTLGNNADTARTKVDQLKTSMDKITDKHATITISIVDNATAQAQSIVSAINQMHATISVDQVNKASTNKATGGLVGGNFATGGIVGRTIRAMKKNFSNGQDTIGTNLSQGEFVIKRSSANQLGISTLEALNSGNLARAYDFMSQRVANTVNSVRNYTTNYNNNAQIHQHIHGDAQQYNGYRNLRNVVRGL